MANKDASNNSLNERKPKSERTPKQKECHNCGYKHGTNKCYAKGKRCAKCQRLNHFARVCRSKSDARTRNTRVHVVQEEASDNELFVECVTSINTVELNEW